MADNVSVKASQETQDLFKKLVEDSGMNNKDFLVNLLSVYELQKAKEITPILTADIEEMETLTKRMNTIFINVSERINTLQRENTEEREQQAETNQSTIALLQQRINGLEQDRLHDEERIQSFIEDKEQAEKKAAELQNRIKEIEDAAKDKAALVEEYKRKNDDLSGIVSEYKSAAEKSKELEQKNAELMRKIEDEEKRIGLLTEKMSEFTTKHAEELKRQQDTLNIEYEKSMLELERRHQTELNEQQAAHSKRLDEYETKILNLINEKTTSKPSSATPKKAPARGKKNTGTEPSETDTEKES